ncbi:MAG: FtsX-like permease family protein [Anaerolineaceae bacterium]|nr:FtsX-like permease family protein [Anaerolineaceae bacterium]MDE0328586.1 FtsX-like permease family protein [Anaerolineaceae bacterium]
MNRMRLYLRLAWQNLLGNVRWTSFAILGVAAGVAAMVALRSLGLTINDALLLNLREVNRGDINIRSVVSGPFALTVNEGAWERSVFDETDLLRLEEVVAGHDGHMAAYSVYHNVQLARHDDATARAPGIISSFFIDPSSYSSERQIFAEVPPGMTPDQLLTGAEEVVLSRRLADALDLQVRDQIRVSGTDLPYTVTGIVPDHSEANIRDLSSSLFGFAYFHRDQALQMQLNPAPNQASIYLPDGSSGDLIRQLGLELWALDAGIHSMTTTPDLLIRNRDLMEFIERLVVLTGLAALLVGGAGIVNTMLVLTGRRLQVIATLKALGMQRRQVATVHGAEALLLGLAGSFAGMLAGLALSRAINNLSETLVQRPVAWRLYPEALLFGLALGLAVTLVFGILPVSIAARVRPAILLRPTQGRLPRPGLPESALVFTLFLLVTGHFTGTIVHPLVDRGLPAIAPDTTVSGILIVAVAILLLAILTAGLWLLVWLLGVLPVSGVSELRLALANLGARRLRSAITLLALAIGVFTLSLVSFPAIGVRQVLQFRFTESLGGNVLVLPLFPQAPGLVLRNLLPDLQQDLRHDTQTDFWLAQLEAIDGVPVANNAVMPVIVRETQKPDLHSGELVAGRDLKTGDAGSPLLVLARGSALEAALRPDALQGRDISPGAILSLRINDTLQRVVVVGIVDSASNALFPGVATAFLPPGLLDPGGRLARFHILDVTADKLDSVLARLGAVPLLLALDVNLLDQLVVNLSGQLGALPAAVGGLTLIAAGVMMANSVVLATLERQRQTGILRALGLRRGQVLQVLLLENTLLGLLGALTGIALGVAAQGLITGLGTGKALPLPAEAVPVLAGLLLVVLLMAWLATLVGARNALRAPVTEVLRYE